MGGRTALAKRPPAAASTSQDISAPLASTRTSQFQPLFTQQTPAYITFDGGYDDPVSQTCTAEPDLLSTGGPMTSQLDTQLDGQFDARADATVPDDPTTAKLDAKQPDAAATDAANNVALVSGGKGQDGAAAPGKAGGGADNSTAQVKPKAAAPGKAGKEGDGDGEAGGPAVKALPHAGTPETGPIALRWEPVQLATGVPPYLAATTLDVEPAKTPHKPGEKPQPTPQLPDYRGAYAKAIADGARFHALVLDAARRLASTARDQNETFKRRQEGALNVTLRNFDDGLVFDRTALRTGRDTLLSEVQSRAWSLRLQVSAAASKAHGALTGKVSGYKTEIGSLRSMGESIVTRAFGGIGEVDKAGSSAVTELDKMKGGINERFSTDTDFLKWAVRNEAIRTYLPPRVERLRKNTEDTRKQIVGSLSESFACLQCNVDTSRQSFEYATTSAEKPAHDAVDAAATGGYKAIDGAASQLTLAIEESYARSDAGLVDQHRAARNGAIETAQQMARQERAALADAAGRQVGALSAVAGAQATAAGKVRDTLARGKDQQEPAFASAVTAAATRLAQNIGNVGRVHPRTTLDAADKLQAGRVQRAAGFERQQQASRTSTRRTFDKIVSDSLSALERHIAETTGSLQSVPTDVRNSANASLQPLDDAFFNGLADYRDGIYKLSASVEAAFSLQAPEKVEASKKREAPKKEGGDKGAKDAKGADKPGDKDKAAAPAIPPPAPPASCAACPPPEKEKAAKKGADNDPNLTGKQQSEAGQSEGQDNNSSNGTDSKAGGVCEVQAPNPSSPNEFIKTSRQIALDPWGVGPFAAFVEGAYEKVATQINSRAETIHSNMSALSTNRATIVKQLKGITRLQGRAIEQYYNIIWDPDLRPALDDQLRSITAAGSTDQANVDEATKALDGDAAGSAFSGLTAAFNYSNEFDRAKQILLDMTPAQLAEMNDKHGDELKAFAGELYGEQKEIFEALIAGHPEQARAIELRGNLDKNDYKQAQERADANDKLVEDALNENYGAAAYADPNAETADAFGMEDPQIIADRKKGHLQEMEVQFGLLPGVAAMGGGTMSEADFPGGALYHYATRQTDPNLDYYRRYPPQPGSDAERWMKQVEGNPNRYRGAEMAPVNKLVIENMLRFGPDSDEARGARLLKERKRSSDPKVDDLDKALHFASGDAQEGGSYDQKAREKGRKEAEEARDRVFLLSEKFRHQLDGGPPPPEDAKKARAQVEGEIAKSYPNDEKARAVALGIVRSNEGDLDAVVEYGADKEKTELLTKYLGRRDRSEIDAFTKKYNATHTVPIEQRLGLFEHHWSMGNMNGAVFSGDKANKLEIAWMGVPQNTKERSEVALRIMDQAIDQAGGLGSFLASEEFEALKGNAKRLREAMGVTPGMVDSRGRIRKTDPLTGLPVDYGHFDEKGELRQEYKGDKDQLGIAMGMAQMYADNYAEATDRVATFVTTALVIAAAIITTALTGGAAASIWLPMLVTAGAGLVGIGLTASIKGGRYGRDDLVRDLAMTVVQTLTAGIGAAGSVAARGGMPALRAVASRGLSQGFRISEKALEKFVISKGGSLAASAGLGAELGIAAGSGALSGGVTAALDPANREGGDYGWKIFGGMARGALGSMAGAGVARGVGAGLGAVGNRVAGAAASRSASSAIASGLSREQAIERALLAARRAQWVTGGITRAVSSGASGSASKITEMGLEGKASWNDILGEAKTAFIQNALQGAIEHTADPGTRNPWGKGATITEADLRGMTTHQRIEHEDMRNMASAAVDKALAPPEAKTGQGKGATPEPPANDNERRLAVQATGEGETGGRVTVPAPKPQEGAPFATGRTPLTEEPGSLAAPAHHGEEPEMMRSATGGKGDNDEGPATRRDGAAAFDPDKTPPHGVPMVEHPTFPKGVDLSPGMLDELPPILPLTQIRGTDPKNRAQAHQNYEIMRSRQPGMEVLIAHNPTTGEYVVVQGFKDKVKPMGEGWVTLRHTHPRFASDDPHVIFASILPSGIGGDYSVLRTEVDRLAAGAPPGKPVHHSSEIDIDVNGKRVTTTFEITKKGDSYTLEVTLRPPMHGVEKVGPVTGLGENALREYAYKARDLTSGIADFGLNHNPKTAGDDHMSALAGGGGADPGVGVGSRVVRGAKLSPDEQAGAAFVAGRMDLAEGFRRQGLGLEPRGEIDPRLGRAATRNDAHDRVRAMGLVGEADSLMKLTRLLNSNDPEMTVAVKSALAQAVLEATRADLIRGGKLKPGDDVVMLFRGVPSKRMDDYEREGINLAHLGPSKDEDAGRGLYGSQHFESAKNYTGDDGQGAMLPLIVRRSELGNVIDVRSGTPLGDRWLTYLRGLKGVEGRVIPDPRYAHLAGVLDTFMGTQMIHNREGRGTRYEQFLAMIKDDPSLPPSVRAAAADPHLTMMDLGGVASYGNDNHALTDQWAMHSQKIADMFNEAHGFPKPGREGPAAMAEEPQMRSAMGPKADNDDAKPSAPTPDASVKKRRSKPKPAPPEGDAEATAKPAAAKKEEAGETGKAPRKKREKQGAEFLDADAAKRADDALGTQRRKADDLVKEEKGAVDRRANAQEDRTKLDAQRPTKTKLAEEVLEEVLRETRKKEQEKKLDNPLEERRDLLEEKLYDLDLDPATRAYLDWQLRRWSHTVSLAEAESTIQTADYDQRVQQMAEIPNAEKARTKANATVKSAISGRNGDNYKAMKKALKKDGAFDDVMGKARFEALNDAHKAQNDNRSIPLSPDHLVSLATIANLPELRPLIDIYSKAGPKLKGEIMQALDDIGDFKDNLVPMRSDANEHVKNAKSWYEIKHTPEIEAKYGYTADDFRDMRRREDLAMEAVKKRIAKVIEDFEKKLKAERAARPRIRPALIPAGEVEEEEEVGG